MAWHFQTDDYVTVADSSVLTLPDSDWMIGGWVRIASSTFTGTGFHRILEAGATDGPRFLIFTVDDDLGYVNDGCYCGLVSDGTNDTGVIYITTSGGRVSDVLNKWVYLSLSHNSGVTHLRLWHPTANLVYSAQKSRALGAVNPATDLVFGTSPGGSYLYGDLANWSMWNVDATQAPLYAHIIRGRQPYRYGDICQWHIPMLGGRYEEWKSQLTVTNYGTTDPGDNPNRLQLITPYPVTLAPQSESSSFEPSLTSAITIEQSASCVNDAAYHASNALSLSQMATVELLQGRLASNTLGLSHTAGCINWPAQLATSNLTLSQTVTEQRVQHRSASSSVSLSHMPYYVGPKSVDAFSFVELVSQARVPDTHLLAATSSILIAQATTQGGTHRVGATSTLVIADVADNIVKIRQAATQLNIIGTADVDKILTAESVLDIQQSVQLGSVWVSANSAVILSQVARYSPRMVGGTSHLNLTQAVWVSMRMLDAESGLDLLQNATVIKPIQVSAEHTLTSTTWTFDPESGLLVEEDTGLRGEAVVVPLSRRGSGQYLSLTHTAVVSHVKASGLFVNASSALLVTQNARLSETGGAASTLMLTHAAVAQAGRLAESEVALAQAAAAVINRGCSVASTLDVRQAAAYTLLLASTRSQYSPFVGASTDPNAPIPPSTSLYGPMAGIGVPFQLVYPSTGTVTSSVSLKTPDFGNKDRLSFNRISRETRGGTVIVFADPDWPKIQTQVLQFSGLLRVEAQALLTFIEDHLGEEVGMIDWEHRYWRGIITVPDQPVIEDHFDRFTASFQFEGELDATWCPQVVPPTLRYSAIRSAQSGGYYVPNEPQLPTTAEADYHTAETDSDVMIGQPVYIKANGHIALASASTAPQVAGLAISDTATTMSAKYITEGRVTRTNWSAITGTVELLAGITYFLDAVAGHLTSTPPSTTGQYVVRVGRATSRSTLDVEIELPILL